jgi:RimJ/RimL family protein N-acetyltransferase
VADNLPIPAGMSTPVTVYTTDRLVVRTWTDSESDLSRIYDTYQRWEVARWLGNPPATLKSPEEALSRAQGWRRFHDKHNGDRGVWAIEVKDTGVVAGSILLAPLSDGAGNLAPEQEIGWHLHPDSWGQGYASEAARGVIDLAWRVGLPEVYAVVYPENEKSLKVCQRLGMTHTGRTGRWFGAELEEFHLSRPAAVTVGPDAR